MNNLFKYLKILGLCACLPVFNLSAQINWNYRSHAFTNKILTIKSDSGIIWIQPFTDNIIKVTILKSGISEPDTSNSVIAMPASVNVFVTDKSNVLALSTDSCSIRINKSPLTIDFFRGSEKLTTNNGFKLQNMHRQIDFTLKPEENIYGTGSRSIPLDRRGHLLNLYNNAVYGYERNVENLNYCIPLVISSQKYMILFDNPEKGTIDIGKSNANAMIFDAIGGELTYYFISGNSYKGLEQSYTYLTGRQPMPPRWVLGNLQSRMSYSSEEETRDIVRKMTTENFPLDAVIIDLDWFGKFDGDKRGSSLMGNLSWDPDHWKSPAQMIKDFSDQGIKTVLVVEPYVIQESFNFEQIYKQKLAATDSLGNPYVIKDFYFGDGLLLDIFNPATKEWFWNQYKKQIDNGIAGWWGDLGEPEKHPSDLHHMNGTADAVHNIYGHYWDKMLFDQYQRFVPDVRLFNLNRSGFAGSQRFSVFPWTGDVSRSWGGFQAQLPMLLSMSMCGLGYIHSDLGGFTPGPKDEELYIRWLQMGVFNPVFRVHSDATIPPEPVFRSDSTKKIIRDFIQLRYEMLPYNYTLAWNNSSTGQPLMRPIYSYEPDNILVRNYSDEYFWGDALLIAPVLYKGQQEKEIYLPQGVWFNFWNDHRSEGSGTIYEILRLEQIPVYVKAGSFIPMISPIRNTSAYSSKNLTIHYYFDESVQTSSYSMYDDDGKTAGPVEKGFYEILHFTSSTTGNRILFSLNKSGGSYEGMPKERNISFIIHDIQKVPKKVRANGQNITFTWDKTQKQLRFNLTWNMNPTSVEIIMNPFKAIEIKR